VLPNRPLAGPGVPFQVHHGPLLVPCLFFYLLSWSEGRKWLSRREPYLALVLGILICSPVIYWNGQNDWMSFRFQLAHGLEIKKASGWKSFGDFWAGQAGVVSPLLFLALLWGMGQSAWIGFRKKKHHFLLLFWTSAPVFLFFAYTSLRSKVEANWPALAYFSAVIALAGIAAEGWPAWTKARKGMAWAVAVTAFLITVVAHLQPLYPLIPIPAPNDPTSQLYGWRTLGEKLKETADRAADAGKPVFLLTPRH
jgi:4-amino-4-deoxy-L-arabinose transferase-like glycosyltransferase